MITCHECGYIILGDDNCIEIGGRIYCEDCAATIEEEQ